MLTYPNFRSENVNLIWRMSRRGISLRGKNPKRNVMAGKNLDSSKLFQTLIILLKKSSILEKVLI